MLHQLFAPTGTFKIIRNIAAKECPAFFGRYISLIIHYLI